MNTRLLPIALSVGITMLCACVAPTENPPPPSGQTSIYTSAPAPSVERDAAEAANQPAAEAPGPLFSLHSMPQQSSFGLSKSAGMASPAQRNYRAASEPTDRENYAHFDDNPVHRTAEDPVSTFSIDVDTGSYANLRRMINAGRLPPEDAVRVEELINYFGYHYPAPTDSDIPFTVDAELAPSPWNPETRLLRLGLQGYRVPQNQLPAANLVFLVDVSGSMQAADKLELLKKSLSLLVDRMDAEDRISLVVYAGASGVVLEPTAGDRKAAILNALEGLSAGGSTNGGAGIRLAYRMAEQGFIKDGINRVLLATDGDFNVGTVNFEALKDLVEEKRKTGIALTTLGFGSGNYNDRLMEQLADAGNGNYAYIDTLNEARKALVEEMSSTLLTIAKDVKIQVEFNPAVVAEYRLIGYENRKLRREDFNNDKVDAGEIGAGHNVTAIYEIALAGSAGSLIDPLRYGTQAHVSADNKGGELGLLRLRYKQPDSDTSRLLEIPLRTAELFRELPESSDDFRFAAAVAGFGQMLRGGKYQHDFDYAKLLELARGARGDDPFGYRGEFLQLVSLAQALSSQAQR
ncbi:MAG: VWA domain-containing protein [Chromatiales bacterium]|nr:VWA domain-containing protein [Chromatiales bacterium]